MSNQINPALRFPAFPDFANESVRAVELFGGPAVGEPEDLIFLLNLNHFRDSQ